jgi:hypothetical protein
LELALGAFALPGYGDGFVRAWSGLVLDQVFEVVIVDVVLSVVSSYVLFAKVRRGAARTVAPFWD